MTTTALNSSAVWGEMFMAYTVVVRVWMIRAPRIVPPR